MGGRRIQAATGLAWTAVALGLLGLVAWAFDVQVLRQPLAQVPEVKANTSLQLVLLGVGALPWLRRFWVWSPLLGSAVAAIALLILLAHALRLEVALDAWWFQGVLRLEGPSPGRMSPVTALAFLLAGLALALSRLRWRQPTNILIVGSLLVVLVALAGFTFEGDLLAGESRWTTGMSVHAMAGVTSAALAVAITRSGAPFDLLFGEGRASRLARRLLVVALVVPFLLGYPLKAARDAGLLNQGLHDALLTVGSVLVLLVVTWFSARTTEQALKVRETYLQRLHESNEELERLTQERTRELDRARGRLQQILANAGEGICEVDREGRIRYLNPVGRHLLGLELDAAVEGRDWHQMVHPDCRSQQEPCPVDCGDGHPDLRSGMDQAFQRVDGTSFPAECTSAPVMMGGRVEGNVLVFRDITERVLAQEAVHESEQKFRALAESAVDAIVAADDHGDMIYANEAAARMFGRPREELVGAPLTVLIPEDLRPAHRAGFDRFIRSGQGRIVGRTVELRGRRADGKEFPVALSLSQARQGGKLILTGILRDLTDIKQREEGLRQSNRDLEAYASAVSHDLQAPLRHLEGFAAMLGEQRGRLDEEGRQSLDRLLAGVVRMQALVDSLLDYSRVSTRPLEMQEVDLNEVVDSVVDLLTADLARVKGEVQADPLPPVKGDPARLQQVFQNLIHNSVRYADAARPLRVRVHHQQTHRRHVIRFEDNGIGFDPQHRERIFRMFQHLEDRRRAGSGLGLAIVRRIVEQHGGTIRAEGRHGEGATFIVELPVLGV